MNRLLVTGSRDWTDWDKIRTELWKVKREWYPLHVVGMDPPVLVHGNAHGVDRMAAWIWVGHHGCAVESHPADWKTHGSRAGFVRNAEMVAAGANLCFAFILNGSRGASMCADLAEKAGIPVRRFEMTE